MNPARLRKAAADIGAASTEEIAVTVALGYRTPYDVAALLRFIGDRAIPGIESVDDRSIRRTLRAGTLAAAPSWIEATFLSNAARVRLRFAAALAPASGRIVAGARRWLDLDAAPDAIDATLCELPGPLGLRLPGSLDHFELAVRAVLGQQITVAGARTLARRLVERFGAPLATPWSDIERTFPAPAALAVVTTSSIAELGIIRTRADAIVALAQAWPELTTLLQARSDPEPLIERLCALAGIGPWTAHYIAMRVLGWPDAFPPNDVAVLKAMKQLFDSSSPRQVQARALAWQPWRSYAVLRLWETLRKPT